MKKLTLFIVAAVFLVSCAARRTVTFYSLEPQSQMSLVPLDNPELEGTKVRNPVTFDQFSLRNRALRIYAPGKASQFWVIPPEEGARLDVKVSRLGLCDAQDANRNRPLRLLMKAYQALFSQNYVLAKELAQKAASIDATLAAPHIIIGLSFLREGDNEKALVSFNQALALDPEDGEISLLIKAAQ